jgi:hypothetical protein
LVEPPGPHDIHFQIEAGDRVEITPEVQAALEEMVRALRGADVQGFAYDPKCTNRVFNCTPEGKCHSEWQTPNCFIEYKCEISHIS